MRAIILLAAILNLLLSGIVHAEDDFGRVFTTPAERASLDRLRQITKLQKAAPDQPNQPIEAVAPMVTTPVSVEGYVKRSDGKKSTVWVNKTPMQEGSGLGEVTVGKLQKNSNQVPIKLSTTGKSLSLKAGQVYDPETGNVAEISARAKQATKDEVPDSGSIGFGPTELLGNKQLPDTSH